MGFGSIGNKLESKESKKKVSGECWSGGSATAPILGRYSATRDDFGQFGDSEYSTGALGSSAVALLYSSKVPF